MHNKLWLTLLLTSAFISSFTFAQPLPELDWKELGKTNPWVITEVNKDVVVVEPGKNGSAPSDAVILFDGKDLSAWNTTPFGEGVRVDRTASFLNEYQAKPATKPAAWTVENGNIVAGAGKGAIATTQEFGDMQLHIEWMIPVLANTSGQAYGNSGVFLMGLYELQVLNSFENPTYSNGQAASIYKQHSPLVNASRKPGEWQTYEVFFTAPRFTSSGTLISPAKMTVVHNGVLVQHNAILEGPTAFIGKSYYVPHAEKLPIVLQDHNNPVRFRNIWVREL
ncbi:DUF1080 domain-containing protein [Paraglaciecola aquimarina]|uniref:DUF1080 domain-containing protein n=1 Tax=Paraglaciecola algarum TaxID=3050085 RepID=A0ABS9DB15_9ALTE|nr:DUF1080 domain-containing protein [Paraglaciecola sp. G1-23]MCF2949577.1 DUF1080 domain-containing protein [Paraglaciecola sp. G1-23]